MLSSLKKYLYSTEKDPSLSTNMEEDISIGVAESVTAGSLTTILCSEPGASDFFKGSVVVYNSESMGKLLSMDVKYLQTHDYATPYITEDMARRAVDLFNSRFGMATTGYSLPITRSASDKKCALNIEQPFAYISLYDSVPDMCVTCRVDYEYDPSYSNKINRARVQSKTALHGRQIYQETAKQSK